MQYSADKRWYVFCCAVCCITLMVAMLPVSTAAGEASQQSDQWLTPTMTPPPGEIVVFEEDFATYSNRWSESESPKSSVAYRDGALVLRVVSPGVAVWSLPDYTLALDTYTLQTTVAFQGGSADSWFGCVLAGDREDNFHAFLVSAEGDWQFVRHDQGEWIDLTPEDAERVTLLDDKASNPVTLQIDVIPRTIDFWINDYYVGSVTAEDEWQASGFGVIARAGHGYVEAAFKTILVSEFAEDRQRGTSN